MIQDLDVVCFRGEHLVWSMVGGLPGLVCWVLGIPVAAFLILYERKAQLANQEMISRFGFLYNGYKRRSYYWESVIMLRKVGMIFTAVFLQAMGTRIQAFAVFITILTFVVVTARHKPYLARRMNDLELVSLVTSGVTIYSGFFFLSSLEASSPAFDRNKDCKPSHLV